MSEEINGQQNEASQVTVTPGPMPSQDKPADAIVPEQSPEGQLPEDVSERTKAEFAKLLEANKQLKQELEASKPRSPSVLDSLRPQIGVTPQTVAPVEAKAPVSKENNVDEIVKSLVDEEGYVDGNKLTAALTHANARAEKAEEEAKRAAQLAQEARDRQTRFEETEQEKKTHQDFPELDPNNKEKFDPRYYNLVRLEMIDQYMKGQNDFYAAAKKIQTLYRPDQTPVTEVQPTQEKQLDNIAKKEQINTPEPSRPGTTKTPEELVVGTMKGDRDSIYERLKAIGA